MISRRYGAAGSTLLAALTLAWAATAAQQPVLDLDSLFTGEEWSEERFGPARWLGEGAYTTLEPSGSRPDALDLVRYDAASGTRAVLVSADELVPDFRDRPLTIEDYDFSPDGSRLLIFTDSQRVWRTNSRGDYWLFDLGERSLRRVGERAPASSLMFAKFSPDGTRVAYVRDNDLYMEDLRNDTVTRLTFDGSPTLSNGTFDWVYEEEFGLRDGFRWSPDGSRIAFWQIDAELVREFTLIDNSELYPTLQTFPYPKAGEINPAARIATIPAGGGEVVWLEFVGSPRDFYLARMEWAGNTELVIQRINRRQNRNAVVLADALTGRTREVLVERDEAWVDVVDDLRWLDGGTAFTWLSERDGWRRAYRVSRDGSGVTPLTPEAVDVLAVERIDDASDWLYYSASPDDPTQRYLFRVPLVSRGPTIEPERLTPLDQPGTHHYQLSPRGTRALHTASRFTDPPRIDLVDLPEHTARRTLIDNDELRQRFAALGLPPAEFFRVEVEPGVELDGWRLVPPGFDPSRRYPVLFHVYGEPAGQTVLDRWGGRNLLWHSMLTQRGYVVMSIDNRGTPAPRGRAWRKVVYGEVGTLAAADQAAAVRALAAEHSWIDPQRIGIWGWSGGGSMTLNALFRYPELYAMGMSVAPVPDQRLYDSIYQERYMNTPQDNPEGYRRGSPITYAQRLQGDLLLVHGTGDDNVHYQGTERLIDALVAAGKQFEMMAYPNRTHAIREGRGTTRHLYGLLTRFLENYLPAGDGDGADTR